ncbi:sulfite exporter TauE/SafE family protein [bacterium]|nr:sulfite exporter TauE/SafE family protein [bacterium]
MSTEWIALGSALWLGVVTSVSPCPLATNVAATSVLARRVGQRRRALAGAAAYTLGRVAAYGLLALIILIGVSSMPAVSTFLRETFLPLVGPILILAGMAVLGWLPLPVDFKAGGAKSAEKLATWGLLGEFSLGALFALSFCPVSAALFFGSLIPIAVASSLPALPVALYGIGTALPVGLIAIVLVLSAEKASRALNQIQRFQKVAVVLTGSILILVGIWLTLTNL